MRTGVTVIDHACVRCLLLIGRITESQDSKLHVYQRRGWQISSHDESPEQLKEQTFISILVLISVGYRLRLHNRSLVAIGLAQQSIKLHFAFF